MDAKASQRAPVVGTAISGFDRTEVDQFLEAAQSERRRLEAEIAEAETRISRARSAIGMHRVMASMLLESQREFAELRQLAETEARQIAIAAERKVATMLETAGEDIQDHGFIDLTFPKSFGQASGSPTSSAPPSVIADADDEYFDFLRGALADDGPLGPGAE
jgi:hypothetical protein